MIVGPILINYLYLAELRFFNLVFSAGDMLKYYGAIIGGLVTAFAIVITVHLNNINMRKDRQMSQFERAYQIYHKLPEILAKLDIAAVHVRYSVHLSAHLNEDEVLIETLDTMKEARTLLREYHFVNAAFYKKHIWELLQEVIGASVNCQEKVERFLQDEECEGINSSYSHRAMEDAFLKLREKIKAASTEIMIEINKFIHENDEIK